MRDNEQIISAAKENIDITQFLVKSKGDFFCCPFCGSGTGKNKTGALKAFDDNKVYCEACHKSADVIEIIQKVKGLSFAETLDFCEKQTNSGNADRKPIRANKEKKADTSADFVPYYNQCLTRVADPEAVEYLNKRGISIDTAKSFFVGYDPEADPASNPGNTGKSIHPCKRLIFPTAINQYIGRRIDGKSDYAKMNSKGSKPGIFNRKALKTDNGVIFIVEGVFDALSLATVGKVAVALNSTSNVKNFLELVKVDQPKAVFVISLDNDPDEATASRTKQAEKELAEGLTALGINSVIYDTCVGYKDQNEALVKAKDAFTALVEKAEQAATPKATATQTDKERANKEKDPEPTKEELSAADIAKRLLKPLSAFEKQEKRYIFKPYLPVGKLSILSADPGVGKTKAASAIAALVTTGSPLLGIPCNKPGKVLLFSTEDDATDFIHTVEACNGNTKNIIAIDDSDEALKLLKDYRLSYDSDIVEEMIKQTKPALVIFDPYQKYLPKGVDMNRANEVSTALSSVVRLAKQYDCHIMIIAHNTKAQTGLSYRFMGSQDFLGEARSGMSVVRDPERVREQENLILHVKSNNKTGKAIRYKIESIPGNEDYARVVWLGLEDYTEKDYAQSQRNQLKQSNDKANPLTVDNPVVRTILTLIKENPEGVAIGYDDFQAAKEAITGSITNVSIQKEIDKISAWLDSEFGIGVACKPSDRCKAYYLKGELMTPTKSPARRVVIQRNRFVNQQQQALPV